MRQQTATNHPTPTSYSLGEEGSVGVQREGEVVLDQILARHAQVKGIPELKLCLHLVEQGGRDVAGGGAGAVQEDIVPGG